MLAPWQGDVRLAGRVAKFQHRERRADHIDAACPRQCLQELVLRHAGDDVIKILGRTLLSIELGAELVPHATADCVYVRAGEDRGQNVV